MKKLYKKTAEPKKTKEDNHWQVNHVKNHDMGHILHTKECSTTTALEKGTPSVHPRKSQCKHVMLWLNKSSHAPSP